MHSLYPDIHPYAEHRLQVDEIHNLYIEESGNAQGIPVLFVHGGPGGGTDPAQRSFFDPEKYRIILFDQRGCGHSRPHAELRNNTTPHLISDMEQIRQHLGIDEWLLFGGSWGATLSLAYAQQYPDAVSGLILRGVFLCREQDVHWLFQSGASRVFPDHWRHFSAMIPPPEQQDMVGAYYKRLTAANEIARMSAAKAWSLWEGHCSTLDPNQDMLDGCADPHIALAIARIEAHYFVNQGFMEPDQLIRHADRLKHIRTIIVHGRYDMVCPIDQAYALYQALPNSELHIVRDAGHSAFEPGIRDNLVRATDDFARSQA